MSFETSAHKVGLGLRPSHFSHLLEVPTPGVSCFEALSEQFLDLKGHPFEVLKRLRQNHPIALHGMSLNLGSAQGVRVDYLKQLVELANQIEPFIVSDHLCWSGTPTHHLHNLLPLPYTFEALDQVCENVDLAQDFLRRPLLLENISTYLQNERSEMSETEFMRLLAQRTGCSLLLDINAVYINSVNHDFDPQTYLDSWPYEHLAQVHLAGHSELESLLIDSHSNPVPLEVWSLFDKLAPRIAHLPIIIERDRNLPAFKDLEKEVQLAIRILEKSNETQRSSELV